MSDTYVSDTIYHFPHDLSIKRVVCIHKGKHTPIRWELWEGYDMIFSNRNLEVVFGFLGEQMMEIHHKESKS